MHHDVIRPIQWRQTQSPRLLNKQLIEGGFHGGASRGDVCAVVLVRHLAIRGLSSYTHHSNSAVCHAVRKLQNMNKKQNDKILFNY